VRKLELLQEEFEALDRRLLKAEELRTAKEDMLRESQVSHSLTHYHTPSNGAHGPHVYMYYTRSYMLRESQVPQPSSTFRTKPVPSLRSRPRACTLRPY
jgi:hypothetical protein